MKKVTFLLSTLLALGYFALPTAQAAAGPTKIILVVPHRVFFTVAVPVYIAQEKGYYKEGNIDVDAVFTKAAARTCRRWYREMRKSVYRPGSSRSSAPLAKARRSKSRLRR